MSDLDRHLYDQLQAEAARVPVPAGDLAGVMARGRTRRHRRAGAVAAAAFVAAASGTVIVLHHSAGRTQITTGTPAGPPAATGPQLNWRVTPAPAGLSYLTSLSTWAGTVYAVSTAPGVLAPGQQAAQQLYRSTDAVSWAPANGPSGLTTAALAVSGGRVYAVGTGPATASVSGWTTDVSWSVDGGVSWQKSVLPIDLGTTAGLTVNGEQVQVAAGPKGVVALVGISTTVNLRTLIPGTTAQSWATTPRGLEVLGAERTSACGPGEQVEPAFLSPGRAPAGVTAAAKSKAAGGGGTTASAQRAMALKLAMARSGQPMSGQIVSVPCWSGATEVRSLAPEQAFPVLATYSWSQLHVDTQLAAALQGEPLAFYSADGTSYRQVTLPATATAESWITATPTGFAAVLNNARGSGTPIVVESADGRNWTLDPARLPLGAESADSIGYLAGRLVVLGGTKTSEAAYIQAGGSWTTSLIPVQAASSSFGPLGVGVVGLSSEGANQSWVVLFSRDGSHWSSASLGALSGANVDNATVVVGTGQLVVTVTEAPAGQALPARATQVALVGTPKA